MCFGFFRKIFFRSIFGTWAAGFSCWNKSTFIPVLFHFWYFYSSCRFGSVRECVSPAATLPQRFLPFLGWPGPVTFHVRPAVARGCGTGVGGFPCWNKSTFIPLLYHFYSNARWSESPRRGSPNYRHRFQSGPKACSPGTNTIGRGVARAGAPQAPESKCTVVVE